VLPQVKVETSLRRVRADSRGALHAVYLAPIHRRTAASCAACRRAGSQRDCGRADRNAPTIEFGHVVRARDNDTGSSGRAVIVSHHHQPYQRPLAHAKSVASF
jgi:hypothetical protein